MMQKAVVTLGLLAAPAFVFAAEAEEQGGGITPFAGDVGSALWTLIIFVLVIFVLGKFAWGPILGALQKREDFIRDSLAQARKDREEAEARLKEYAEKLEAARTEASAIVDEGRRDAEVVRRRIEEQAKTDADAMLKRAKREISVATETAVKDLYTLSAKLVTDVASRVIRRELDGREHERLMAESIEELRNLDGDQAAGN